MCACLNVIYVVIDVEGSWLCGGFGCEVMGIGWWGGEVPHVEWTMLCDNSSGMCVFSMWFGEIDVF